MQSKGPLSNLTIALLVVGLVVGAAGGYLFSSSTFQAKIKDYEGQVNDLTLQVSGLTSTVSDLETMNSNYEEQVTSLENQVSNLQTQMTSLETELAEAQDMIEDQDAIIQSYEGTITDLEATIEALQQWNATPGYYRYSTFGLSFEYPETWSISLSGLLESKATENSGEITATSIDGNDVISVGWVYTLIIPSLDKALDDGFQAISMFNPTLGPRISSTINGHALKYQSYTLTYQGETTYGVNSVWYCDANNKTIIVSYGSTQQEILPTFQKLLDSFICH